MKRLVLGAWLALTLVCFVPACAGTNEIPLILDFDGVSTADVKTYFVGVYTWDECGSVMSWLNGVAALPLDEPPAEEHDSQTFEGSVGRPIDALDPGHYSILALGIDEFCTIVVRGCSTIEVGVTSEVSIDMNNTEGIAPLCMFCDQGYCGDGPQ